MKTTTLSKDIDKFFAGLGVRTSGLRWSAGRQAVNYIISQIRSDSDKELSMNKIYKLLQDDFDIHRACAESRLRRFQIDVLSSIAPYDRYLVFGEDTSSLTNHEFIYRLAKYMNNNYYCKRSLLTV